MTTDNFTAAERIAIRRLSTSEPVRLTVQRVGGTLLAVFTGCHTRSVVAQIEGVGRRRAAELLKAARVGGGRGRDRRARSFTTARA